MTELQTMKVQLQGALDTIEAYESKPTKAESARVRKVLGEIKKGVTPLRAALVTADKA